MEAENAEKGLGEIGIARDDLGLGTVQYSGNTTRLEAGNLSWLHDCCPAK